MTFQFESWQAFWHMGGYGFFVWLSVAVSAMAVGAIYLESWWAKKQLIRVVNEQIARKKRIQKSKTASPLQSPPEADASGVDTKEKEQ